MVVGKGLKPSSPLPWPQYEFLSSVQILLAIFKNRPIADLPLLESGLKTEQPLCNDVGT